MSGTKSHVVSFSGIDGAGKSSQIDHLKKAFEAKGLSVRVIAFWDSIATLKQFRESAGHSIFKGDQGVGSPSAPINRRDKNVQSLPMTLVRLVLYFSDAFSNRRAVKQAKMSGVDLIIFDRYIYDELANLNLSNPFLRFYARGILKIVPRPHIGFLLDADPAQARARKPEYPLEFLVVNRTSYLELAGLSGHLTVVPAVAIDQVTEFVTTQVSKLRSSSNGSQSSGVESGMSKYSTSVVAQG
jgi:thymidylate kinase